jgi:hypothetical protein
MRHAEHLMSVVLSTFAVTTALAAGALAANVAEDLFAAAPPMPGPLARDEEFVVRLSQPVAFSRVTAGNLRVTQTPGTTDAYGMWAPGRALIDPVTNRAVVVRPEAVREYFELVKGQPREDAQRSASSLLRRVESTGKLSLLKTVDEKLRVKLGLNAGTRLDDETTPVDGTYPARLPDTTPGDNDPPLDLNPGDSPLEPYRTRIAGDDDLWWAYLTGGDIEAYSQLARNPEYERFYHPVDAATGAVSASSVLRQREYRRVLIRRSTTFVTFMPAIPNKADLTDAGYASGATYGVSASGPLRGKTKTLLPARGGVVRFVHNVATFGTEPDTGIGSPFLGGTPWTGAPTLDASRVVNVTPPDGEVSVDPTTDWEDPDNRFTTPLPQRRLFVIRLRFSAPLDPRTVDASHFLLTKTAVIDDRGYETPVHVAVAVGVFLAQTRGGEIRVDMSPATNLDPGSKYEVRARDTTRALNGRTRAADFTSQFVTAQ